MFETGLSAREAYFEVIHCPSAKGIDEGTLRSACEVSYEGSKDEKRKTIEEATEMELLRPQKVIGTFLSLLQPACACFKHVEACFKCILC